MTRHISMGTRSALVLAACLALSVIASCSEQAPPERTSGIRFDFEPRGFFPTDHYIKDHTLVIDSGTYHLFYITGTDSLGRWTEPGNEVDFGHATSRDLRHWTVEPRVVTWTPAPYEERNRWAPHVVRFDNGFRMYYTGVNRNIAQVILCAESTDLAEWTPAPMTPFHPDASWAFWDETAWSDCRDPFVFQRDGRWWMIYTATTSERKGALGLARSDDGLEWRDLGPLFIGNRGEPPESAQLVELDGRWFLLFTAGLKGGTWVIESESYLGPYDFASRRRWLETIAPEVTRDGDRLWISRHGAYEHPERRAFGLWIDKLVLDGGEPALDSWPRLGPGWATVEGNAFTQQPTLDDPAYLRGEAPIGPSGRGWIGTREGFMGPPSEPKPLLGEAATGLLRSHAFVLDTPTVTFRIGGSNAPQTIRLALRRASDDAILRSATGSGRDELADFAWDTRELIGERVYLEALDASTSGFLNLDAIDADAHR